MAEKVHCDRCDDPTHGGEKGFRSLELGVLNSKYGPDRPATAEQALAEQRDWEPAARLVIKVEIQDEEGHWKKAVADICDCCMYDICAKQFPHILRAMKSELEARTKEAE